MLSVCILTRDEPGDLQSALRSAQAVADEIVVVANHDTSSQTWDVARQFNARLVAHRWNFSFAEARNAGLDAARGDWVYWIDTDEELVTRDRACFGQLMEQDDVLAYYVQIQDAAAGDPGTMTARHHRSLYRRRDDIRYVGRVHEHFEPTLEARAAQLGMRVELSPVRVNHCGYSKERSVRRLKRNVELMELELRDRPAQLYYQIELGRSLLEIGDERGHAVLNDAARSVLAAVDALRAPSPMVAALLEYAMHRAGGNGPITADRAAELAMRWFPRSPPLLWHAARWQYSRQNWAHAAELLQQLIELGESGAFDRELTFDRRVFGDEARLNLGVCCARAGQLERARKYLASLANRSGPFAAAAAANLRALDDQQD